MLSVCHTVLSEDEDQTNCGVVDLLRFDENATRCGVFRTWFDPSTSVIWTPKIPPPSCRPSADPHCESDDSTCESTEQFLPQHVGDLVVDAGGRTCTILPKQNTEFLSGISPVLKRILDKDASESTVECPKVKWCSSLTNAMQAVSSRESELVIPALMMRQINKKCVGLGLPMSCRGKWVVLTSDLKENFSLDELWTDISLVACRSLAPHCNISFQTEPSRVLIYTDFLHCLKVPLQFRCIRKLVRQMSYVIHPHGEVLTWNAGEIVFK